MVTHLSLYNVLLSFVLGNNLSDFGDAVTGMLELQINRSADSRTLSFPLGSKAVEVQRPSPAEEEGEEEEYEYRHDEYHEENYMNHMIDHFVIRRVSDGAILMVKYFLYHIIN